MLNKSSKPRSVRNNNPLNIRKTSDIWQGQTGDDGEFVKFETPEFGFRAAARILGNYQQLHGLYSVAELIGRWAPSHENPTNNYVNYVAEQLSIAPDETVPVSQFPQLMLAMSVFEGSKNFTIEQARTGAAMA